MRLRARRPGFDGDGRLEVAATRRLRDFGIELELSVAAGERLAIVGPSGAGKTTVLKMIAGLIRPDSGRIRLSGSTLFDRRRGIDVAPEDRRCGYLFQDYALFPGMSAWRNVAYGMRGGRGGSRRGRAVGMLDAFGAASLADAKPDRLSGGERQRVALARALATEPRLLLFDEPLSALDPGTRSRSLGELDRALTRAGAPAIIVTHSFDEAAVLGDRVAVVDRGRIVQSGGAAEISARPASKFVADFTGAVVLEGTATGQSQGLTVIELDGGGRVQSVDEAGGRAAIAVFPWEISLEPNGSDRSDSALNRLPCRVVALTALGNRVRVGLELDRARGSGSGRPQRLTAEITSRSAREMGLEKGSGATAAWKATATRVVGLGAAASSERHDRGPDTEEARA